MLPGGFERLGLAVEGAPPELLPILPFLDVPEVSIVW